MSIHTANDDFAAAMQARDADDLATTIPSAANDLGKALRAFMDAIGTDEADTVSEAVSDLLHDHISDEIAHHSTGRHHDVHSAAMRGLKCGMDRAAQVVA